MEKKWREKHSAAAASASNETKKHTTACNRQSSRKENCINIKKYAKEKLQMCDLTFIYMQNRI